MNLFKRFLEGDLPKDDMDKMAKDILYQKFDEESKQRWQKVLKDEYKMPPTAPLKTASLRKYWRFAAIAASILLLVVAVVLLNNRSLTSEQLADRQIASLSVMADQSVFRKGDEPTEAIRIQANEAYLNKDFAQAITLWENLRTQNTANLYDSFYLAASYLRHQPSNPVRTIALLQEVEENSTILKEEIDWVLSLAYIKNQQLGLAQDQLQQIVDNQQYMKGPATEILRAMND